jgi:hypothetical protein
MAPRKPNQVPKKKRAAAAVMRRAYTVPEFCEAYRISRRLLYLRLEAGDGPQTYMVGGRRLISVSAAEAWQEALEKKEKGSR